MRKLNGSAVEYDASQTSTAAGGDQLYDGEHADAPIDSQHTDVDSSSRQLGTANRGVLDQLARFVAAFHELRRAHDALQIKHAELEADRDQISTQLESANKKLDAILPDQGSIAPSEARDLALERDALHAEVARLRDDTQTLLAERSNRESVVAELEKRLAEMVPIRDERDALATIVQRHEDELKSVRSDRAAIAVRLQEESTALAAAQANQRHLTQQLEQIANDVTTARRERDQTSQEFEFYRCLRAKCVAASLDSPCCKQKNTGGTRWGFLSRRR
jgi:chromosome segregation ATPase